MVILHCGGQDISSSELKVQSGSLSCMEHLLFYIPQKITKLIILNSVVSLSLVFLFSLALIYCRGNRKLYLINFTLVKSDSGSVRIGNIEAKEKGEQ